MEALLSPDDPPRRPTAENMMGRGKVGGGRTGRVGGPTSNTVLLHTQWFGGSEQTRLSLKAPSPAERWSQP